jgi:hypothetical protein
LNYQAAKVVRRSSIEVSSPREHAGEVGVFSNTKPERGGGGGSSQLNGIEGNGLPSALSLFFYSHNIFFDAVMKNWKG